MPQDVEALRALARRLHAHYDVQPEVVIRGSERVKVGFEVRLWAVHPKGARALPGCPKCLDLVPELERIANWALPREERPTRAHMEPFRAALYDSPVVPGSDEISLSLRLVHRDGYDQPIDACEERCLKEIRSKLREIGVPER
jgi:hypothetical protein